MSPSARWAAVARQAADGTGVGAGSKVLVLVNHERAADALAALADEVYRRGARLQVLWAGGRLDQAALAHAPLAMLEESPYLEEQATRWADVQIELRAMVPPSRAAVDSDRLAALRRMRGRLSGLRWQETRWTILRVPTPEWAHLAGVPFAALEAEFFEGCLAPWGTLRRRWADLARTLGGARTVRIADEDGSLDLDVTGRTWAVNAGESNLPDGEVYTAPVETATRGRITFPGRFWFGEAEVADLRLEFEAGRVVRVEAERGAGFVRAIVDSDAGSARVGELGIGLNAAMRTLAGDLLIDEKVPGTVHIALGRAYPECGGVNASAIHWDIVKDLRARGARNGGDLLIDGAPLIAGGALAGALGAAVNGTGG